MTWGYEDSATAYLVRPKRFSPTLLHDREVSPGSNLTPVLAVVAITLATTGKMTDVQSLLFSLD